MTEIPSVGMYRTDDHQYYWQGDGPYTSVTTAMSTYDKSDALVGWAKKETAAFAMRNLDVLVAHRQHNYPVPECPPCATNLNRRKMVAQSEAARMWVSSIPDYMKDAASDLGTRVHAVAEAMANGVYDGTALDLSPYAVQYRRFLDEWQPSFLAIEYMGLNRAAGYGGTGDIIGVLNRRGHPLDAAITAIDIKTWTKPEPIKDTYYPETAMQLSACSRFEFIGKPNDPREYPMPRVEAYAVLLLGPDDYRLIPYAITDDTFDAFLATLTLHRWKNGEAKTIVGRAA